MCWDKLADVLRDCRAVLVANVGQSPQQTIEQKGIRAVMMEELSKKASRPFSPGNPSVLR